jgi:potassium efflux system protein
VSCAIVAICAQWTVLAHGQDASAAAKPAAAPVVSEALRKFDDAAGAELQNLLAAITDPPAALADADKTKWQDRRREALTWLETGDRSVARAAQLDKEAADAPQSVQKLKAQLTAAPEEPTPPDASRSLAQLEQDMTAKQAALVALGERLGQHDGEIRRRVARRIEIPKLTTVAMGRVAELEKLLGDAPPENLGDLKAMDRAALLAEKLARRAEVDSLQKEALADGATAELLPLERDQAARDQSREEKSLKQLRQLVDRRRQEEAERSARQAEAALVDAAGAHPSVRAVAARNAQLADRRKSLASELTAKSRHFEAEWLASEMALKPFANLREKDQWSDVANRGVLLHKHIKMLPNEERLRSAIQAITSELGEAQLAYLEFLGERSNLADPEREVERLLGDPDEHPAVLRTALRQHLETKRENLDALVQSYLEYSTRLIKLKADCERNLRDTALYREYIAERVLWVRSTAPLDLRSRADLLAAGRWLVDPNHWIATGQTLLFDAARLPLLYLVALAGGVALFSTRRRLRARIHEMGSIAARGHTDTFRPTAVAAACTVLVALVWPLVVSFLAWRLIVAGSHSLAGALGWGLLITVVVYLPLELLRQVCRPLGLADAHFDWPRHSIALLRRSLRQLILLTLTPVLVTAMMYGQDNDDWSNALGRSAFVLIMFAVSRFIWQVLKPSGGVLEETLSRYQGQWLDRLRWLWFPVSVGAPLALAGLALAGFYYTAMQLAWRLESTIELLLGLLLTHAMLLRLLVIVRRRLAIEQARQRRAALTENRDATSAAENAPDSARLDLAVVSTQTRHLLQSAVICGGMIGMCAVWVDVLPALEQLHQYVLWGSETNNAITLGSLLGGLLVGMMTFLAARNIPGLLEISVLQKLPLQPGSGYAITTISRYVIVIIGATWTSRQMGLQWGQVQWLVAAISVGLGFGLQEIFGNFISGLIILFERPIRVGDTITVGGTSGAVSRIRMRATTIVDADRKELIVPNKEFITGQVVNWTLSDDVVRVSLIFDLEYGTDISLAQRLILKAAYDHPNVMEEPAPSAYMEGYRDDALRFQFAAFLPHLSLGSRTRHELLETITRSFQSAGIRIAQRPCEIQLRGRDVLPAEQRRSA